MKTHIEYYVKWCQVCQKDKIERVVSPGLPQPLQVPQASWDMITMDFIDGLPQSGQHNCIWVLVDWMMKASNFLPLVHPCTTSRVAPLFMQHIYPIHGFPHAIISNRDPTFTSHLWQELFHYADTELRMSTTKSPPD